MLLPIKKHAEKTLKSQIKNQKDTLIEKYFMVIPIIRQNEMDQSM